MSRGPLAPPEAGGSRSDGLAAVGVVMSEAVEVVTTTLFDNWSVSFRFSLPALFAAGGDYQKDLINAGIRLILCSINSSLNYFIK